MARYYCDYCDARCSNNSASVRTQHNSGNLHRRNVSAFYSQFIGKDVQDKIDALVAAFEARIARGEVVPTYATFPRSAAGARADKAKDGEAAGGDEDADGEATDGGGDGEVAGSDGETAGGDGKGEEKGDGSGEGGDGARRAAKRPRADAPAEGGGSAEPQTGDEDGGDASARDGEREGEAGVAVEKAVGTDDGAAPGGEQSGEEGDGAEASDLAEKRVTPKHEGAMEEGGGDGDGDGDGGDAEEADPAKKKRRRLDGGEEKDGARDDAGPEESRDAVSAGDVDAPGAANVDSAAGDKGVAPAEQTVRRLERDSPPGEDGPADDDGSDMDMDG